MTRWNILFLVVVAAVALVITVALPATPAWSDGHEEGEDEHAEEDALHEAMEHLGDDFKALRRAVVDPEKKGETLEIVARMQANTLTAKGEVPHSVEEMEDGTDKHAAMLGFRKQMAKLLGELAALEIAVLEGRRDDAIQHVRNLGDIQRAGHREFKVDDDD